MEGRKNTNGILLTVIGAATLLVALVGATFAYFSATSSSANQEVDTGHLAITTSLGATSQANIMPTTWSDTLADNNSNDNIAKFALNVNTTGTTVRGAKYDISLTKALTLTTVNNGIAVANQGGEASQVMWKLYKGTTLKASGNYGENDGIIVTGEAITDGSGQSDDYTLYVYIAENNNNQDKLQGATVAATLTADAYTPKVVAQP